jgi:transposase
VPPRLIKNSKLTNRQLNHLIGYFALEALASRAAKVMDINRHSAERVYQVIRGCLAREVEADESYFGGRRKGSRGRGAAGKVPVFGLLKRNGKVYTRIVEDVSRKTLRQIIPRRLCLKASSTPIAFAPMIG